MHPLLLAPVLILTQSPASHAPASSEGQLRCTVVVTIDMAFWDRWDYSSESSPVVSAAKRVVRGQHFGPNVFIAGPAVDEQGHARLRQDLHILRPDGSVYHEEIDQDAYSGPVPPGELLRTPKRLGVYLEPEDALGVYRVEVTVRDLVAGTSNSGTATIELTEYEEGAAFASRDELEQWLTRYKSEPDPSRLVPAVLAAGAGGWEEERGTLHGALRDLFDANTWLLPELLAHLDGADVPTRRWILWIASRGSEARSYLDSRLDGDDLSLWKELAAAHDPLVDPIRGREDINELWGMYWPRRSIFPILRLCSSLSGVETGSVADILLPSTEFPEGVPLWMVVQDSAARILTRGMEWDPLVRDFCAAFQNSAGTPPGVQRQLQSLLKDGSSKR